MTIEPTAMLELEATNILLATIGEERVSTLTGSQVGDVAEASATLLEVSREVQAKGWHFNREIDVAWPVNGDSKIPIPLSVARFDMPSGHYPELIRRGGFVYDKTNRTNIFTASITTSICVFYLPFDELPDSARNYITLRAARRFSNRMLTSKDISQFTLRDEMEARAAFLDENEENGDHSLLDNWSVGAVLDRPTRRSH